jgi:hypothetical protein
LDSSKESWGKYGDFSLLFLSWQRQLPCRGDKAFQSGSALAKQRCRNTKNAILRRLTVAAKSLSIRGFPTGRKFATRGLADF